MSNIQRVNGECVVYKVVNNLDGRLYSALHPKNRLDCAAILRHRVLEYEEYTTVWPKFGKIFAFATWKDAKTFRDDLVCSGIPYPEALEVWKATTSHARPADFEYMPDLSMSLPEVKKWWRRKFQLGWLNSNSQNTPDSTVICDDLTLWRKK